MTSPPLSQAALVDLGRRYLYPNYRQPAFVFARGQGSQLWDVEGKRYLDFFAGIAVSILGHAHPALVQAIQEQAGRLIHLSNYFYNEPNVRLAERLCRASGMDRAFFCNSGTEAIEACLKLARRHFFAAGQSERVRVVAFENSFHGRTLGALAATGQNKYREGFGLLPHVTHVPYGNADAVRAAMGPDVAALLAEPVQGEGGVQPAPPGFLAELRKIADANGSLLILDEIQTGLGRTGTFLASEFDGVRADVVALAKGLGGGVPIGAMLCREQLSSALPPGSHGSTFGGNPLASAAALAVLETVEREGLMEAATEKGKRLSHGLSELANRHRGRVAGHRGRGLLQALLLADEAEARPVLGKLQEAGLLLTLAGSQALRFSPPLVVSEAEIDEALAIVGRVLAAAP
jgi:acetylornithine/N-succinyldiaminopimelate aminotransferase